MLEQVDRSREGLVGPQHLFGGLSLGNLASMNHAEIPSSPRAAALESLSKMEILLDRDIPVAVYLPQPRLCWRSLRRLGFHGSKEELLAQASKTEHSIWLRRCSSSSNMWAANAATIIPSNDSLDEQTHIIIANLSAMYHRSIEAPYTTAYFEEVFASHRDIQIHEALAAHSELGDEGAANHTRLSIDSTFLHLFAYGKLTDTVGTTTSKSKPFPARQAFEASSAVARLGQLKEDNALFLKQSEYGIRSGAFHTDVLAVGAAHVFLMHEAAFEDLDSSIQKIKAKLPELHIVCATEKELPIKNAVAAYPFNSQLIKISEKQFLLIAPEESETDPFCRRFLERCQHDLAQKAQIDLELIYTSLKQSMSNGGGPACLRLRLLLPEKTIEKLKNTVLLDHSKLAQLRQIVQNRYPSRFTIAQLSDALVHDYNAETIDEICSLFAVNSLAKRWAHIQER